MRPATDAEEEFLDCIEREEQLQLDFLACLADELENARSGLRRVAGRVPDSSSVATHPKSPDANVPALETPRNLGRGYAPSAEGCWSKEEGNQTGSEGRSYLATVLRRGADLLENEGAPAHSDYNFLIQVQHACRTLQQVVDESVAELIEQERKECLRRANLAAERQREAEQLKAASEKHQATLLTTIQQLHADVDKRLCIICFDVEKDSVILPCTHFTCCWECLAEHQKEKNTCPTCRTPISGVLRCCLKSN